MYKFYDLNLNEATDEIYRRLKKWRLLDSDTATQILDDKNRIEAILINLENTINRDKNILDTIQKYGFSEKICAHILGDLVQMSVLRMKLIKRCENCYEPHTADSIQEILNINCSDCGEKLYRGALEYGNLTSSLHVKFEIIEYENCKVCGSINEVGKECFTCDLKRRYG